MTYFSSILNNMADNNTTYIGGHYIAGVIGVIGIIGVTVNFITIIALLRHKALRQNASTAFVINLSISDLIYALSGLPLFIIRYWSDGKINNDFLCYMDTLFHIGHVIRCMLSMMAITINRYILICKPTNYAKLFTIRNTVIYLIGIWIISILELLPTMLQIWGQVGRSTKNGTCKINDKNGNPQYFMLAFNGVVPIMIIIFCYIRIYKKVEIRDNNESTTMPTDIKTVKNSDIKNYENGPMIKLMMMMLTSFVIIYLTLPVSKFLDPDRKCVALRSVAVIIYCSHVFINPFIFYGNNKVYRLAYKQLIYPRFPSENTNSY